MGNLCIRGKHGHTAHGAAGQHGDAQVRRPGHSDADASYSPQVTSRDGGNGPTRAQVKRERDRSPLSQLNSDAAYPPPMDTGPGRRRSSVKRERDAAISALRNLGDGDYPPPVTHATGKTRKQVKAERDAGVTLSSINHDL